MLPSKRQHSKLLLNGQLPKPSSRCQWRLDNNISSPHVPAFLQKLLQVACLVATNKIPNTKQNKGILACFLNYPHTAELFKYVGGRKKHGWLLLAQFLSERQVKSFPLSRRGTYSSNCILPTFVTVELLL